MSKLSKQRKVTYYLGNAFTIIGLILFLSSMIGFRPMGGFFLSPILGFVLVIIGKVVAHIGRLGLSGSGILLDPEKAREDLKPYSTSKGKMINDALEEVDILQNFSNNTSEPLIKVRCHSCKALNDETATYCSSCGTRM